MSFSTIINLLDITLVYLLTYRILVFLKRNHALNLIKGVILFFILVLVSQVLGLKTFNWIMSNIAVVFVLVLIILFRPELRRYLERIGATGQLFSSALIPERQSTVVIKQLLLAVDQLSREKRGAIIVIEMGTNLTEYVDSGILIHGEISEDLLSSLFWPGSPTHDGAVIIRDTYIEAAGCLLPLSEATISDRRLGTRHRAALGLSELSDAVIIVVSEETGVISLVENGVMTRFLTKEALETRLFSLYKEGSSK